MIQGLFETVITVVTTLVNFILSPIDNLIMSYLPDLSNLLNYISSFFNYIANLIPWVVSYFGLNFELLSLVSLVLVFKVTVSMFVYVTKLAVKWYNYLKI